MFHLSNALLLIILLLPIYADNWRALTITASAQLLCHSKLSAVSNAMVRLVYSDERYANYDYKQEMKFLLMGKVQADAEGRFNLTAKEFWVRSEKEQIFIYVLVGA